ncbi:MAG: TolC family protein [Bryobacterales bacterium]|nr:TolC family protein [Bryobacterales bacterium]
MNSAQKTLAIKTAVTAAAGMLVLVVSPIAAQFATFPDGAYFREQWQAAPYAVEIEIAGNLEDMVVDGKLELSLRDYLELVMANHPDVQIQKLNVLEQENSIQSALSPFDPNLDLNFNANRSANPSQDVLQGGDVVSSLRQNGGFTYRQTLDTGTNYQIGFTGQKSASSSSFRTFNPSIQDTLSFRISQPLLRNRGRGIQRIPVMIAQSRYETSQAQARQRVLALIAQSENTYWQVVSNREALTVQENNLELRRQFLERSRRELELGAISELDIFQPEQNFANAQVGVTRARYRLQQAEDRVRRQIGADLHPEIRNLPLVLTESADPPLYMATYEAEETLRKALLMRPEIMQQRKNLEIDDYNIKRNTNAQRPDLSLTASYSATGLGGNLYQNSLVGGGSRLLLSAGGSPAAMEQLLQFAFPTYSVGITLNLPLRNRRAAVNLANSVIQKKRNMYQLQSLEQQIRLDVLNAIAGIELSKAAIQQAAVALDYSQKRLDAEQLKYDLGVSTAFIVLDAQDDLVQSQADLLQESIGYRLAIVTLLQATGELLDARGVRLSFN